MSSAKERLQQKMAGFSERLQKSLDADREAVTDTSEEVRVGALKPLWDREKIRELEDQLAKARELIRQLQQQADAGGGGPVDDALRSELAARNDELRAAQLRAAEIANELQAALQARGTAIEVALSDLCDSPFQPRLRYDSDELERLAESLAEQGQKTAIAVRRRADGKLELLEGHRRKRAAARAGLQSLRAVVVECSDDDAFMTVTTAANVVATTTEYEKARTFRAAKERMPGLTQAQLANLYAVTQARVSQCLTLLELPKGVLELLDKEPGLVGGDRVKEIRELLKTYPEALVVEAVERLTATPRLSLTSYVKQRSQSETRPQKASRGRTLKDRSGRTIGTLLIKERVATVRLEKEINEKAFSDALVDALGKLELRTP